MSYEGFAEVYDAFMEDADHAAWMKYIEKIWKRFEKKPELVLDLGCGTGSMSVLLAKSGREVIGIDNSIEMLMEARSKAAAKKLDILYLLQDMRAFELYGTVDSVISVCDSMNYILRKRELLTVCKLVNNYLNPGGLFIFDMNTAYRFERKLGDNIFTDSNKKGMYVWENYYDRARMVNHYKINFFIKRGDGLYKRHREHHRERAYDIKSLKRILRAAGLSVLGIYDAYSFRAARKTSERIYVVAAK